MKKVAGQDLTAESVMPSGRVEQVSASAKTDGEQKRRGGIRDNSECKGDTYTAPQYPGWQGPSENAFAGQAAGDHMYGQAPEQAAQGGAGPFTPDDPMTAYARAWQAQTGQSFPLQGDPPAGQSQQQIYADAAPGGNFNPAFGQPTAEYRQYQGMPFYGAGFAPPPGPVYCPRPQMGSQAGCPLSPPAGFQPGYQPAPPMGQTGYQAGPQYSPQGAAGAGTQTGLTDAGGYMNNTGYGQAYTQAPPSFGFPGGALCGAAFGGMPGFNPASFSGQAGTPGPGALPRDDHHYAQMLEFCNDLMQGKTDPSKIAGLLSGNGSVFWKGAIIGALLTFILTNSSVKSALAESFSAIFGAANQKTDG